MFQSNHAAKKSEARRTRLPKIVYPLSLPILERRGEIIAAIRENPVLIITGETGSGKTTQIPKMCLEAGCGRNGLIGCTQPRRIAATTVARRIAEEMGEQIGRSVGYKIRFDDRTPRDAFLKIMTDGILLMETHQDPLLRAYDTIIVDEAHERSLNIDFILGILKKLLEKRRDLRVIITSATIDTEKFSRAFGSAPVIEVSGRLYPVEVRYEPLDPGLAEAGELTPVDAAVRAVEEIVENRERGDILIFMPTERDIRETCALLTGRFREDTSILPLFSRLSLAEQQRVFGPSLIRKIIVATNVAETSITIPNIRFVIDTGLSRLAQYNPRSRTSGLPIRPISRSSADQRKGRCGRVQNGICIRLFSEEDYLGRPLYTPPEILRSSLAGVILRMLALGLGEIESFPFIDRPAPKSIRDGIEILLELGAIEAGDKGDNGPSSSYRLTPQGRLMAELPLDPRISRMILEGRKEGCLPEIVVVAGALSIQDPRERPADKEAQADQAQAKFKDPASDFSSLLGLWRHCYAKSDSPQSQGLLRRFCRDHFLSYRRVREWRDIHDQIFTILKEKRFITGKEPPLRKTGAELYTTLHRSILSGYLGHIAQKKEKNLYTATKGRQAMIFPGSGLFNRGGPWIVAAEMVETSRLFARTVANIECDWLEALGGPLCRRTYSEPHWERDRGEVVALEQVTLFGLVIVSGRPASFSRIDPEEAAGIFIRGALVDGDVKHPLPFLSHNQALIEKIEGMEEKIRRRDLLVEREAMAQFYTARLKGICDIRSLQRLIRDRGSDLFLRMKEEDLLAKEPDAEQIALYPEAVSTGGWRLDCVYRFSPGQPEDGITLKIPVQAVPSLPAASLDWSVPGLLREKVMALLKGLPKEYRKRLQPLAQTCEVILREVVPEGPLPAALGRFLYERFGVDIPSSCWPIKELADHLQLRYAIVDEKNKELSASRDIDLLRRELVDQKESRALAKARQMWEKDGITAWDFGELPRRVALTDRPAHALAGFPALAASESGIGIRLFQTEREADSAHRRGVGALLALRFREELRHLRKAVAPAGDLKLWAAAFGGGKALENAVVERVRHDLFEADVRSEAEFQALAGKVRPRILPLGQEILRIAGPPLKALYDTSETLRSLEGGNRGNGPVLKFLAELRQEAACLLSADFFLLYEDERLIHISRYLRALAVRAERGALHLEKALERGKEIKELADWRGKELAELPSYASEEKRRALADFLWLIEEYKVSLFAQELKTAVPVSRKRIEARMVEIQRML